MIRLLGTPLKFCRTYLEWLQNQEDWMDGGIKVGHIKTEGKIFQKFIAETEEDCFGYKLIPERRVK